MRYLRLFESFNGFPNGFPNVFNNNLLRGVKNDNIEYIDDPSTRKISTSSSDDEFYIIFLKNYSKLGIPDPTKSIHMYFNPDDDKISMISYYGKPYNIYPKKESTFGFCKELRNGGLGSTYWFPDRTFKDFLGKDINDYFPEDFIPVTVDDEEITRYSELVTKYQQMLIDAGVVGKLTYNELIDLSKNPDITLQVWTESPCLHVSM